MFKMFKRMNCRHVYDIQDIKSYYGASNIVYVYKLACVSCNKKREAKKYEVLKLKREGLII